MSQVYIDTVIWTMLADHKDEMEMRVNDAMLGIHIDDANKSVNKRDTAAAALVVPQSLSFYIMFYKMTLRIDACCRKEEKKRKTEDIFVLNVRE